MTVGTETLIPVSVPDLPADKHRLLIYQPGCSLGWSVNALIERERLNLPKCADLRAGLADSLKAMVLSGLGIGCSAEPHGSGRTLAGKANSSLTQAV